MRHLYFNLKDLFSNRKGFVILTSLLRFKNKSREFREFKKQNVVFTRMVDAPHLGVRHAPDNLSESCPPQFQPIWPFKGTNGRQKTYEIFHVYGIFYSGFMSQTTVIFGITKDGSLVLNTLASWNCFTCRNLFQNGANDMSECLTFETAFCKKSSKFGIVRITRFWSNFASLW